MDRIFFLGDLCNSHILPQYNHKQTTHDLNGGITQMQEISSYGNYHTMSMEFRAYLNFDIYKEITRSRVVTQI